MLIMSCEHLDPSMPEAPDILDLVHEPIIYLFNLRAIFQSFTTKGVLISKEAAQCNR